VPYGSPVTLEKLTRIDRAEAALKALGFRQCRVRDHDGVARVEVDAAQLAEAIAQREPLVAAVRAAGFSYVTLDLEGFRSGSLNEVLRRDVASV
jgi:pyridinium-3,5-biscarboxylic acid mononucleotide sulfurtransferase